MVCWLDLRAPGTGIRPVIRFNPTMHRSPRSITIRDIETIPEMREVEALQQEVWGVDDREIFPALALIPMREVGGILIGAFAGDRMAGFVFGFPGHENGRLILHSDMLAVRPEYRSLGLGYRLKLAQRKRALEKGIDTITWTFDPLQALNARLNFGKLGVTANRYCANYYGETTSFLHQTGTDRLWVTWSLDSQRVRDRIAGGGEVPNHFASDISALVRVGRDREPIREPQAQLNPTATAIEIPDDINRMLRDDIHSAIRWREATRHAFMEAMAAGYVVEDFCLVARAGQSVGVYLLTLQR